MFGLGTIINFSAIIVGGIIGLLFGKKLPLRIQKTTITAIGVAVLFLGITGVVDKYNIVDDGITGSGSLLLIGSLTIGAIIGELLNIDKLFEKFGNWLKVKTKSENDTGFLNAFLTATFTVSIGAMAIIGSIEDGISGKIDILLAKSILDGFYIMIVSSSLGKGCVFSAIPVLVFQGLITIIFHFVGQGIPQDVTNSIGLVGSAMIFCIGINMVFEKDIKVANFLPALIIASVWAIIV